MIFALVLLAVCVLPIAVGCPLLFAELLRNIRDGKTVEAGQIFGWLCMCVLWSQFGFWGLFAASVLQK